MSVQEFDILVVGGGLVGASLVNALSVLPLRVGVVEATPLQTAGQPSYDDRSTALSWGSRRIFESLGLWSQLRPAATPIHTIHVSDRGRFGATRLSHNEERVEALGYVVENRVLGQVLWRSMKSGPATLLCPARLETAEPGRDHVSVLLRQDEAEVRCSTKLLVVADGARSATRAALGIDTEIIDYEQSAVIANVTPERFHDHVAYERFIATGPLAFLPMSNGRCSVVWTLSPSRAADVMAMDDAAFLTALQSDFGYRLGELQHTGARHSYPLSLARARQLSGLRHVLVGNAAHGLHPVAGQGFNLGLRDIAALAEVIAQAGDDADPGTATVLRRYCRWRQDDHGRVLGFTDGLIRVFTSELTPVRVARGVGLTALDLLPLPRSTLARQSMGLSGRLPRLARGLPLR